MSLSCGCDFDGDGWYYYAPKDYTTAPKLGRRKRCCSCKQLINLGATALTFDRYRQPSYGSIEEKIFGEGAEIQLASYWMCESCGDQYFNLEALGFCITLPANMHKLREEYVELYIKPKQEQRHER